ncbi:MAG: peroxiredoxin [Actinomycetota bacterium]|nr:peroxiredoxin [Actinomycetota bacterium]
MSGTIAETTPRVGQEAPDFSARDTEGQTVTLRDLRGKNVLLVFYPFAFSGTCTKEFCELRDANSDIATDEDVEVFGVSCDPVWAIRTWKQQQNYPNRFLSDFWPHGAISRAYGAFDEKIGSAVRSTFLIDKEGIIRYAEQGTLEQLAIARDQGSWREALAALP